MSRKPNDRRDALKALFAGDGPSSVSQTGPQSGQRPGPGSGPGSGQDTATPDKAPDNAPDKAADNPSGEGRARSGAVRAMGLQLGALGDRLDRNRSINPQDGERVITLDPALIDAAFVADRLSKNVAGPGEGAGGGDETFDGLVASIRDGGQQVPVLVRPHPDHQARYQAAYGHRRIAACRVAGVPVRAIVRPLTDGELVLAQGRENAMRRDLSFIEKARFAAHLVEAGFSRAEVQRALVLHAADMTRMLAVATAVPSWAAQAIGPAPKAGRARWDRLAQALTTAPARSTARKIMASGTFAAEDSDARFARVLKAVTKREQPASKGVSVLKDRRGRGVATLSGTRTKPVLTLDMRLAPDLLDALRRVIEDYEHDQPETGDGDR